MDRPAHSPGAPARANTPRHRGRHPRITAAEYPRSWKPSFCIFANLRFFLVLLFSGRAVSRATQAQDGARTPDAQDRTRAPDAEDGARAEDAPHAQKTQDAERAPRT